MTPPAHLAIVRVCQTDGPWRLEPDREVWMDPETGFRCAIMRHPRLHHLCGYVALPAGHPWHGFGTDVLLEAAPAGRSIYGLDELTLAYRVTVHGGITYGGAPEVPSSLALPEDSGDGLWWFGFDCAHGGDLSPGLGEDRGEYRTIAYVREECREMARQLAGGAHDPR